MTHARLQQPTSPQSGFTLIELLLYLTIASVLLLSITLFFTHLIGLREKDRAIGWVDAAGVQAMDTLTRTSRRASGIVSPLPGATDVRLVIDDNGETFTFFEQDGVLVREDALASQVALTPQAVRVANLTFDNNSNEDTMGVVDISFNLSIGEDVQDTFGELYYKKEFTSSAALRF